MWAKIKSWFASARSCVASVVEKAIEVMDAAIEYVEEGVLNSVAIATVLPAWGGHAIQIVAVSVMETANNLITAVAVPSLLVARLALSVMLGVVCGDWLFVVISPLAVVGILWRTATGIIKAVILMVGNPVMTIMFRNVLFTVASEEA